MNQKTHGGKRNGVNKRFDFREYSEENARWDRLFEQLTASWGTKPRLEPINNARPMTLLLHDASQKKQGLVIP